MLYILLTFTHKVLLYIFLQADGQTSSPRLAFVSALLIITNRPNTVRCGAFRL